MESGVSHQLAQEVLKCQNFSWRCQKTVECVMVLPKEKWRLGVNNVQLSSELIFAITPITISLGRKLASRICNECMERLLDPYIMREMCIKSQQRLPQNMIAEEETEVVSIEDVFESGEVLMEEFRKKQVNKNEDKEGTWVKEVVVEVKHKMTMKLWLQHRGAGRSSDRSGIEPRWIKGEDSIEKMSKLQSNEKKSWWWVQRFWRRPLKRKWQQELRFRRP